eukprot:4554933-Prymnesium_polylepis.2
MFRPDLEPRAFGAVLPPVRPMPTILSGGSLRLYAARPNFQPNKPLCPVIMTDSAVLVSAPRNAACTSDGDGA